MNEGSVDRDQVGGSTLSVTDADICFLDNPGMIAVTQPRRVAAVSTAARVGTELGVGAPTVAHQVRYDSTTKPSTCIKFMTDGILMRELAADVSLSQYSVIIIDEAHERSLNSDILIGMISRLIKLRAPSKDATKGANHLKVRQALHPKSLDANPP